MDEITRLKYRRDGLRYASDTTEEEWAVIEPLLPSPAQGRGRRRTTMLRVGDECDLLHRAERLPMAHAAEGFPALHDGAAVLLSVAQQPACGGRSTMSC